ncbi:3-dehydroquinate synthase [bacterium]|nr:3-dehydroquinate synthase [bacterium]
MTRANLSNSFKIDGKTGSSDIKVGGKLEDISIYSRDRHTVIITDSNVSGHYRDRFGNNEVITIKTGESIKTLQTLEYIYKQMIFFEVDRNSLIIAIGGGIVCDIAGFAASTFMRGLDFGFVATSLLAQVDASVGGKNGVNFDGFKNMIGVFQQPDFVICDLDLLDTLPERELKCGFSEVVKHALIADSNLFNYIESNCTNALGFDKEVIFRMVDDSIRLKSDIVNKDETERGERAKLNFGHTIGHALQYELGLNHGEAVSIGMVYASALSVIKGYHKREDHNRIIALLQNLGLPVDIDFDITEICKAVKRDKKRNQESIKFVLLNGIGDCRFENININELEKVLNDLRQFFEQ